MADEDDPSASQSDDDDSSSSDSSSSSSAPEVDERVPVLEFLDRPSPSDATYNRLTLADASIPPGGDGAADSFAMLPSSTMRRLSLAEDDFVLLTCAGTKRSTVCAVLEDPYCDADTVLTNGAVRANLGAELGDTVSVWLLDIAEGKSVHLETTEKTNLGAERLAREYIVPHYLEGDRDDDCDKKPVFRGDLVPIPSAKKSKKSVTFRVVKSTPSPCCLVGPGTAVHVNGKVAVRPDIADAVMYEESPAVLVVRPADSGLASEHGLRTPEEALALTRRLLRTMVDVPCPACRSPMPPPHQRHYLACCGSEVCVGCRRLLAEDHKALRNGRGGTDPATAAPSSWPCPFCRTPHATGFDQVDRLEGRMAKCNDPRSYFELGINYLRGKSGLHKDVGRAIELFNEGAVLGSVRCHETLGLAYRKGLGVDADESRAAYHMRAAADMGCVRSRRALAGMCVENAVGTEEKASGARHMIVAAGMGCAESLSELQSIMYVNVFGQEEFTETVNNAARMHDEYCRVFHTEARRETDKVKGKGGS